MAHTVPILSNCGIACQEANHAWGDMLTELTRFWGRSKPEFPMGVSLEDSTLWRDALFLSVCSSVHAEPLDHASQ